MRITHFDIDEQNLPAVQPNHTGCA